MGASGPSPSTTGSHQSAAQATSLRLTEVQQLFSQRLIETHRQQLVAHGFPAANEGG